MCLNPTLIKNVNHFSRFKGLNALNVNTDYIAVPCGVCSSCVALKQSFFIQRCQLESFDNDIWFCTLTYNNDSLPVKYVNGRKIRYADKRDLQCYIKMLRKYNVFGSNFRYMAVSEFGSSKHRPHWHLLFFTPKIPNETFAQKLSRESRYWSACLHYWRRNYGSTRKPLWKPLLTYRSYAGKRNYDFHYVNPSATVAGEDDVAFYVTKYVLKFDDYVKRLKSGLYFNMDSEDFSELWSEVKPHFLLSKGFGDINNPKSKDYVRKCIQTSLNSDSYLYPIFINPVSGQEFPLSPYLRNKFLTVEDEYTFFERRGALNYTEYEDLRSPEYKVKKDIHDKVLKRVKSRNSADVVNDDNIFDSSYESPYISIKFIHPYLDFSPNFEDFDIDNTLF